MKGLKLSKTSWLILSAGVFVVVLAGLGLTRSQQLSAQNKVNEELDLSAARLDKLETTPMRQQLEELQAKLEDGEAQMREARERLRRTVVSVDVTDEFFKIAEYCDVTVMSLSTTKISKADLEGISVATTSVSATVTGEQSALIDFVISLNKGFTTGFVDSAKISIESALEGEAEGEEESGEGEASSENVTTESGESSASVHLVVFSYEGK